MIGNQIKAGSLVLINVQQSEGSRIFGIVEEVNFQENKLLVTIISPTSSGRPISFGQERLAVVGQMQASDARKPDVLSLALVATTQTICKVTRQLIDQDQEIRDLRQLVKYYQTAEQHLAQ